MSGQRQAGVTQWSLLLTIDVADCHRRELARRDRQLEKEEARRDRQVAKQKTKAVPKPVEYPARARPRASTATDVHFAHKGPRIQTAARRPQALDRRNNADLDFSDGETEPRKTRAQRC
eukprot:9469813-Pyramimonas_sp.AAC.2